MRYSHKRKIASKRQQTQRPVQRPTMCFIDPETIVSVTDAFTIVGGVVAVPYIPEGYRKVRNGIRKHVLSRFLDDSKSSCKYMTGRKTCNAVTKIVEIQLKNEKSLFVRKCTSNPGHLMDVNGDRIKLGDLSPSQYRAFFG